MKVFKTLGLALLFMAFQNCNYVYYPTYPVVPDTKGEGIGVQAVVGPTRAQASAWYAVDSNVYVLGTLGYANADENTVFAATNFRALSGQIGLGYKKQLSPKFEFQIQGGGGLCSGRFFNTNIFTLDPNFNTGSTFSDVSTISKRGYIAPIFGFINPGKGVFYLIPRVTYESFSNIKPLNQNPFNSPTSFKRQTNILFGELYGMARIDARALNVDIIFGWAGNLNFLLDVNNASGDFNYVRPFMFGVGLSRTITFN